jgi:hypothetical protein
LPDRTLYIAGPVWSRVSKRSCIYVLGVSFLSLFLRFSRWNLKQCWKCPIFCFSVFLDTFVFHLWYVFFSWWNRIYANLRNNSTVFEELEVSIVDLMVANAVLLATRNRASKTDICDHKLHNWHRQLFKYSTVIPILMKFFQHVHTNLKTYKQMTKYMHFSNSFR